MKRLRHTKIQATIGPASDSPIIIQKMVEAGVDGFRINFSHTNIEKAVDILRNVRKASEKIEKPVTVRQDLQGPKIRIGELDKKVHLTEGQKYSLVLGHDIGNESFCFFECKELYDALFPNDILLINDGQIKLKVTNKKNNELFCRVEVGGILSSRKGINVPGISLNLPALTEKDKKDLEFAFEFGVDCISLSFVKTAADVLQLKNFLKKHNKKLPIIAKIELLQALKEIDKIISTADGISIARGDLGVESPMSAVPFLQEIITSKARKANKFVMVGSEFLSSMRHSLRPSRADVTDVFYAVNTGTDVISLSDETTIGENPVACVKMLDQIIKESEKWLELGSNNSLKSLLFSMEKSNFKKTIILSNSKNAVRYAKEFPYFTIILPYQDVEEVNFLSSYKSIFPVKSRDSNTDSLIEEAKRKGIIHDDFVVLKQIN
ncbi:MAG: pyruvate kinase [Eubacteriales bacterium]